MDFTKMHILNAFVIKGFSYCIYFMMNLLSRTHSEPKSLVNVGTRSRDLKQNVLLQISHKIPGVYLGGFLGIWKP